jgi:hypothetical protein
VTEDGLVQRFGFANDTPPGLSKASVASTTLLASARLCTFLTVCTKFPAAAQINHGMGFATQLQGATQFLNCQ